MTVTNAEGTTSELGMDENGNFTPRQIEMFKADPDLYKKFVKTVEVEVNGTFPIVCSFISHCYSYRVRLCINVHTELRCR
jgi:hypothetical protein